MLPLRRYGRIWSTTSSVRSKGHALPVRSWSTRWRAVSATSSPTTYALSWRLTTKASQAGNGCAARLWAEAVHVGLTVVDGILAAVVCTQVGKARWIVRFAAGG